MRILVAVVLMALLAWSGASAEEQDDGWSDWYAMLEVQGGTTLETKTNTFRPYVAGKFGGWKDVVGVVGTELDVDEETEAKGPVTVLAGATYNLGNLKDHGVEVAWAKHFGFNVGACGTYNWIEDIWGWRVMLSIVDISQSEGNAKKQRER